METISSKDIRIIHALLAALGLADDKEYKRALVETYSHGRVSSTTELYVNEAGMLRDDLQALVRKNFTPEKVKANDKRRLMLHYAHEMMWELPNGKVDMDRLNEWCKVYGMYHKPLMYHNLTELSFLIHQFEKVYQSFLKSV